MGKSTEIELVVKHLTETLSEHRKEVLRAIDKITSSVTNYKLETKDDIGKVERELAVVNETVISVKEAQQKCTAPTVLNDLTTRIRLLETSRNSKGKSNNGNGWSFLAKYIPWIITGLLTGAGVTGYVFSKLIGG